MRDICLSLTAERGLVIQEWVRYKENDKTIWKPERFVSILYIPSK